MSKKQCQRANCWGFHDLDKVVESVHLRVVFYDVLWNPQHLQLLLVTDCPWQIDAAADDASSKAKRVCFLGQGFWSFCLLRLRSWQTVLLLKNTGYLTSLCLAKGNEQLSEPNRHNCHSMSEPMECLSLWPLRLIRTTPHTVAIWSAQLYWKGSMKCHWPPLCPIWWAAKQLTNLAIHLKHKYRYPAVGLFASLCPSELFWRSYWTVWAKMLIFHFFAHFANLENA